MVSSGKPPAGLVFQCTVSLSAFQYLCEDEVCRFLDFRIVQVYDRKSIGHTMSICGRRSVYTWLHSWLQHIFSEY